MVSVHKSHPIGDNASAKEATKDAKNSIVVDDEDFTDAKAEHLEPMAVLEHPDRETLEKQVVRRLDMTLLPVLWVSRD